jgi:hypothetical protein
VIATLSADCPDRGFYPDNPGNLVNAICARLVFEHWYGGRLGELAGPDAPFPALPG